MTRRARLSGNISTEMAVLKNQGESMDDMQVNWRAFSACRAVIDIRGGAAMGGVTYWGDLKNIYQEGNNLHIIFDRRVAVMDRHDGRSILSTEKGMQHNLYIPGVLPQDLPHGGISVEADHLRTTLIVFPKGFKPKEGQGFEWCQVEGSDEWHRARAIDAEVNARASGSSHSSDV